MGDLADLPELRQKLVHDRLFVGGNDPVGGYVEQ